MKKISVSIKGMPEGLGYSFFLIQFVGVAKVLGIIATLIPGFPGTKNGLMQVCSLTWLVQLFQFTHQAKEVLTCPS